MWQALVSVVADPAVAVRAPTKESMESHGLQSEEMSAYRIGDGKLSRLRVHCFLETDSGFAGRSAERDDRHRRPVGRRLLGEERDDLGHDCRLSRTGAAGDYGKPTEHRRRCGKTLA